MYTKTITLFDHYETYETRLWSQNYSWARHFIRLLTIVTYMKKIDWDLINHQNKQAKQKCWSGWAVHGLIYTFVFCLFLIVWLIRFTFLFQIHTLGCREMHAIAGKIDHCEWKGQWKKSMSGWREQNLWWVIYIHIKSLHTG